MDSWVKQPGFPVVHAVFDGKEVALRQSRFFLRESTENISAFTWSIPITYISKVSKGLWKDDVYWLEEKEQRIEIPNAEKYWVILNVNKTGKYIQIHFFFVFIFLE